MNIGIFPAAAPLSKEMTERALGVIKSLGHSHAMPLDPSQEYGTGKYQFSAASVQDRLGCLTQMLNDDSIEFILCTRGAYGSQELLPNFPFDLVQEKSKPLVGLSDITALLWAVYTKTNSPAILGPVMVPGFSDESPEGIQSRSWLFDLLAGKPRKITEPLILLRGSKHILEAKVVAGNLTVFCSMTGTPYQANFKDHIVILEDKGEPLFKIHRMLSQMRNAGCFDSCKGVVLGDFSKCENAKQQEHPTLGEVFLDVFKEQTFPIFRGFPLGHDPLNYSIKFGETILIDATGHVTI